MVIIVIIQEHCLSKKLASNFLQNKAKYGNDDDCILYRFWIKSLFGHDLISLKNFRQKKTFL
jgi:hypothetical protein